MQIEAPFLQTVNDKTFIIIPEGMKFPFIKISVDFIFCSHKTWKDNKYHILKNTLNKPKVFFLDNKQI